jgi:hypothetical protein
MRKSRRTMGGIKAAGNDLMAWLPAGSTKQSGYLVSRYTTIGCYLLLKIQGN